MGVGETIRVIIGFIFVLGFTVAIVLSFTSAHFWLIPAFAIGLAIAIWIFR